MKIITIKKWNDFILAVFTMALGIYLRFDESIITGTTMFKTVPWLADAKTYMHGLGLSLILMGLLLLLRNISFKKERVKLNFALKKEVVLTAIAMIAFVFAYNLLGFFVPTFGLVLFLSMIYCRKEEMLRREEERMSRKRFIIFCSMYSLIIVAILYVCFTKFLGISFQ